MGHQASLCYWQHINGLMQERRNSIANALELRLSCTNPSIYSPCNYWSIRALMSAWNILGNMVSHYRVIIDLSQSAPAMGWGSPLHAWLASVNWISGAHCLNRRYHHGAHGMHCQILLRQYRKNCYTYNSVVKNTYSPCHKHACVQISIGNTEWLLRYKGIS